MEEDNSAYGGVIVNELGQVLLREPTNHFDGYVWTWPKGRPKPGDTPEQAALREVQEETGYPVEIIAPIPGVFQAAPDGSRNTLFLMRVAGEQGEHDWETASLRWATPAEARMLIAQTTYKEGAMRDLAILEAAEELINSLPGNDKL